MLTAKGIVAGYRGEPILQGVDMTVQPKQLTTVLGPNGAGKSTLFKALLGFVDLQGGSVVVGDRDISRLSPYLRVRAGVGYVPQLGRIFSSLTVRENLEMGGFVGRAENKRGIEEIFDIFPDLGKVPKVKAGGLSGGQQTMLGMGRALMLKPTALLLDEPTAGLSPLYTERVWEAIRAVASLGVAILVIEQNVTTALRYCDYCYILRDGRNATEGIPDALQGREEVEGLFLGA
jgi:branched-chain amino acid transport system ATP-binding protein